MSLALDGQAFERQQVAIRERLLFGRFLWPPFGEQVCERPGIRRCILDGLEEEHCSASQMGRWNAVLSQKAIQTCPPVALNGEKQAPKASQLKFSSA